MGPETDYTAGHVSPAVRLVIADDHPIVLEGLEWLVSRTREFVVVERCTSGAAVVDAVIRSRPDMLVMDVRMPPPDGLEVLRDLRSRDVTVPVLLLTAALEDDKVLEAIRLGVRGLVPKDALAEQLICCLRAVAAGGTSLDPVLVGRAAATMMARESAMRQLRQVLTTREVEIFQLVARGLRNREIAGLLFITEGTLKVHLHRIFDKLGFRSRSDLVAYAGKHALQ